MQREYKDVANFYKSKEWIETRNLKLWQEHFLCERCKAKGIIESARVVHHKIYINRYNINDTDITLNLENLEALCQTCHNREHKKPKKFNYDCEINEERYKDKTKETRERLKNNQTKIKEEIEKLKKETKKK